MRRLLGGLVAALLIVAVPAMTHAGQATATKTKAAAPKTMSAEGTVTAVSPDSLTVKGKTAEWTFTVDKKTSVTAKGATHKSLALKAEGKAQTLSNFVKAKDEVTVSYQDLGASKLATKITVTAPAK